MTGTLQKLIDGRYELTAYCHACDHRREIDLNAMAKRFGPDAPVLGAIEGKSATIAARALRCSVAGCRSYRTSFRISPSTSRGSGLLPK
ncbi:hypothetical protein SAMN02745157_1625 [Kaistia soli DSM 19436]|uniref:Uncharacterized protein n=1 Tax=Kaistia soli DSM 19436 TaxID=1122133 RepID=A0A1M4YUK9_9HYPH|nr:hypothetical protein [Kaistia soli]SHF09499.1 hypothetical protein SAMN02745157_1625 [Kaistia soli DSM 19436]